MTTPVRLEFLITPILCGFLCVSAFADAGGSASPNFVPDLRLSYVDPQSGERISCGDGCRRLSVPAGVELEVRVRVQNSNGDPWKDGVAWDLWFDQPIHPFPGIDIAACRDPAGGPIDLECWQSLFERVDWETWDRLVADRVCVPEKPGDCEDVTIKVPMDENFDGSRGRGVYSFAAWVDRFRVTTESDEFDNFAGPVRVRVLSPAAIAPTDRTEPQIQGEAQQTEKQAATEGPKSPKAVVAGSSPMPYAVQILPAHAETGFTLASSRSRGRLEFSPAYAGEVLVEVEIVRVPEKLVVQILKVSTGEILAEGQEKARLRLQGGISSAHLKDDRRFEVVVSLAQGSRGARGTIRVSYPERALYRRAD